MADWNKRQINQVLYCEPIISQETFTQESIYLVIPRDIEISMFTSNSNLTKHVH